MSCPDCYKGAALSGEPKGTLSDVNGAYLASGPTGSSHAVVLLTDIFGLGPPNPKLLADFFSEQLGCDVYVPDLFDGNPPVRPEQMIMPERAGQRPSLWGWIKIILVVLPTLPAIFRNRPSVTDQRVRSFMDKLKSTKNYDKIGAVGYCFGGATAIRFGSTGFFDTLVICHPGRFSIDELKAIKVPSSWVCAEDDMIVNHDFRLKAEAAMAERKDGVVYEFRDYKGTTHGFAARPNIDYPEVKEAYEGALQQTVDWFKKTLTSSS
ncbi:dienelactone hydrolase endo-1,3,1,4-beta-D-glucanase [Desarmillaria tabescens]|uniref:Dienelactone hydrolase endo-1,3,1,4-beta-D-glucanase n=1 Tax=Armillaria tabescens TaxID=1929756 RepID=A0AA39IW24_ARMTA|nr:dienelactone hydrolase endo-1,3,1,4-beta-D-glucanase [Desarmillaria tabescens]KAK0431542.1 dienelactone hydrolase endo-1,3,1,4-beta-D-glucanase [Desarmillaria tabescens]